jgi:hypothetical protein
MSILVSYISEKTDRKKTRARENKRERRKEREKEKEKAKDLLTYRNYQIKMLMPFGMQLIASYFIISSTRLCSDLDDIRKLQDRIYSIIFYGRQ